MVAAADLFPEDKIFYENEIERDLSQFPLRELEQLIDYLCRQDIDIRILRQINQLTLHDGYFQKLERLNASPEFIALVGHAVAAYLQSCINQDELWQLQFLFPPLLDPNGTPIDESQTGEPVTALNYFTQTHLHRNLADAPLLAQQLLEDGAKVLHIRGPMYSAKSGIATELYQLLLQEAMLPSEHLHTLIFSGMGESSMHARSSRHDIPAEPVDITGLDEFADRMITTGAGEKQIVFIEEATFFATHPDSEIENANADKFVQIMQKLTANNISVVLIGLDNNYRVLPLAITSYLTQLSDSLINYDCTSFFVYPDDSGTQLTDAETTIRFSLFLGMFDWGFPILVPRDLAIAINYFPTALKFHVLETIRVVRPDIYQALISLNEEMLLTQHNLHASLYLNQQRWELPEI